MTTMYVVIAPFILWLFWHQAPRRKDYFAIILAVIGMALLSGISPANFTLQLGDLLTLISAIFWALQLIYFAKFASTVSSPWIVIFLIGLVRGASVGFAPSCLSGQALPTSTGSRPWFR